VLLPLLVLFGCGRDWDAYDPRLGAPGAGGAGTSSSTSGTGGGGQVSSSASGTGGMGGGSSSSGVGGTGGTGGTGGGGPCTLPLQDDFNDGTLDTTIWDVFKASTVNVAETNGELLMELPDMPAESPWVSVQSKETYDLTGCSVFVQVLEGLTTDESYTSLQLIAGSEFIEIVRWNGYLRFKRVLGGVHEELSIVSHDLVDHAYWRMREQDGTTYWDTSPDGKSWQNWAMAENPVPVTSLRVILAAGTPTGASAGRARFDNVDIVP